MPLWRVRRTVVFCLKQAAPAEIYTEEIVGRVRGVEETLSSSVMNKIRSKKDNDAQTTHNGGVGY